MATRASSAWEIGALCSCGKFLGEKPRRAQAVASRREFSFGSHEAMNFAGNTADSEASCFHSWLRGFQIPNSTPSSVSGDWLIIVPLPRVDSPQKVGHFPRMSTLAEIEAALPELSAEELRRVEALLHRLQNRPVEAASTPGNPRLKALDALQSRLALDSDKADAWVAVVQEARR